MPCLLIFHHGLSDHILYMTFGIFYIILKCTTSLNEITFHLHQLKMWYVPIYKSPQFPPMFYLFSHNYLFPVGSLLVSFLLTTLHSLLLHCDVILPWIDLFRLQYLPQLGYKKRIHLMNPMGEYRKGQHLPPTPSAHPLWLYFYMFA